jgi:two-component system, cell cycle sensor histidine kinase and response regulator CckA
MADASDMIKRTSGGTRMPRASRPAIDPVAGLAGSIAHDYSNLLMVIQNSASLLQDEISDDHQSAQKHLNLLLDAAERARRLTRELQAFGRAQLLNPELVKPGQIVRGMSDMLRHLVPSDVDFRISIRATNAKVLFDVAQLRLIILNLVAYAAERVRKNGRLVLAVGQEKFDNEPLGNDVVLSGPYVTILVAKTGAGLDSVEKKKIFEPGLTGKHLPGGTDLRLAGVQGVVTQSGGVVDVTSERGRGTTFRVFIPIAAPEAATPVQRPRSVRRDVSGSEVILVVEDDKSVRSMVQEMLERHGYTALEAADGAEALRVAELYNTPPDLLLTDLVMPELSGRELIEELRVDDKLPKVLLMSGYTDDEVLRRGSHTAEYPFIKKPFTHYELAAKVRAALDS